MKLKIIDNDALAYDWWVNFTDMVYQQVDHSNWLAVETRRTELLNQYNASLHNDTDRWSEVYVDFESEEMATLFLLTFS